MTNPIALDLLKLAEHYLSALHGSVARHDNIGLNLSCGGCALRDEIRDVLPKLAAAVSVPPPAPRAVWREAAVFVAAMNEACDNKRPCEACTTREDVADALRRLADEATPVAAPSPPANEPGPDVAAAIASCPGYEMSPNPCRCPCDGCKHHCAAHNPAAVSGPCVAGEQQNETPEGDGCWCGHPEDRHWAGSTRMTFPDGCHDCRGWNGAHGYGQELPWLPEGDEPAAGVRQDGAQT